MLEPQTAFVIFSSLTLVSCQFPSFPIQIPTLPWDPNVIEDEQCRKDVNYWLDTLKQIPNAVIGQCADYNACKDKMMAIFPNVSFAMEQIDSFGKIPADLMHMTHRWQGSWDECVAIRAPLESYRTKFCWVNIGPNLEALGKTEYGNLCSSALQIYWSVCMPRSCNDEDVGAFMASMNNYTYDLIQFCSADCRDASVSTNSARFWIPLAYCILAIVLLIISSLFDYITKECAFAKDKKSLRTSTAAKVLLTFSLYTNGSELLSVTKVRGQIDSLNCIRAFSITWVMVGHSFVKMENGDNLLKLFQAPKPFLNDAFINAFVSVDSFLFVGGLLLAYLFFRDMEKKPRNIKSPVYWTLYYVHRIVRLSPCYFLFLGFYVGMYPYLNKGPAIPAQDLENCERFWWRNILYINNLFKPSETCMGHTWYLALDMQIHILAPIFLIPMFFSKIAGTVVALIFLLGSIGATYATYAHFHFPPSIIGLYLTNLNPDSLDDFFQFLYYPPWIRFTPHLIGMFTGYFLFKHKDRKLRIHPVMVAALWAASIALGIACVFSLFRYLRMEDTLNTGESATYYAFHRIAWSFALAWVVIACQHNYAGPLKNFMELGMWMPLGRLTYCAYMTHYFLIDVINEQNRYPLHYTNVTTAYIHLALPLMVVSYVFAFFWSCSFEIPFGKLERMAVNAIIGTGNWKSDKKEEHGNGITNNHVPNEANQKLQYLNGDATKNTDPWRL